jgi:hypothetical protein
MGRRMGMHRRRSPSIPNVSSNLRYGHFSPNRPAMLAPHRRFIMFQKIAMLRNQRQLPAIDQGLGEIRWRELE